MKHTGKEGDETHMEKTDMKKSTGEDGDDTQVKNETKTHSQNKKARGQEIMIMIMMMMYLDQWWRQIMAYDTILNKYCFRDTAIWP